MKRVFILISVLCLLAGAAAGCGKSDKVTKSGGTKKENIKNEGADKNTDQASGDTSGEVLNETNMELLSGRHQVEIVIRDQGSILAELDADQAPVTVTNFINLVKDGFYDGLTFHRIIEGFMMQGGDPKGDGTGGSEHNIKGEFSENGVENTISHTRGTLSMARANAPDSGSSQFFIVQEDSTYLDGQYAGFGIVTQGMELVDAICRDAEVTDQNGTVKEGTQPVIETIKVMDESN